MAKGRKVKSTTNVRTGGGGGGTSINKGTGMHRARKMNSFSRVTMSSSPISTFAQSESSFKRRDNILSTGGQNLGAQNHKQTPKRQQHQNRPIIPFGRTDRILLVGEGDFSFAHSLVKHHHCQAVLATCYDSREELYAKYPHVGRELDGFLASMFPSLTATSGKQGDLDVSSDGNAEIKAVEEKMKAGKNSTSQTSSSPGTSTRHVLFSIDARKLGSNKDIRRGFPSRRKIAPWKQIQAQNQSTARSGVDGSDGPWDTICFNFPHVGGLTTDVNRQVRANQELLVAFFKASKPLLSCAPATEEDSEVEDDMHSALNDRDDEHSINGDDGGGGANVLKKKLTKGGQLLITLFEGEPYTLWNIKDLARHAGLSVVTSFKFPWNSYPGYSHARTIGAIEGRNGGPAGWRGEDRLARTFVFDVREGNVSTQIQKSGRKRNRDDSDSNH